MRNEHIYANIQLSSEITEQKNGVVIGKWKYDKDSKKKTEEVEALKLHLGSMKIGNSVDIRLEATELPKIEPYAVVELEEPVYAPYVQRGNFPVLVEKITCKGIRPVPNKNM